MALNYERLMRQEFPDLVHSYSWRDTIIYALGLGIGSDPVDPKELRFVYEKELQAMPTMAVVMGHPGFWYTSPEIGIDLRYVLHGEQSLTIYAPLPAEGVMIARNSIDEVIDKGEARGALLRVRRDLIDQTTGKLQSTQVMSMVCRANGGFGGPATGKPQMEAAIPDRAPDRSTSRSTLPQTALIYRLSADLNPLHADPEVAEAAGFDRPILHGLGTLGIAAYTLIAACRDGDGSTLRDLGCRFSAPVYPGETLRTDMWEEGDAILFRCMVVERNKMVLDRGRAVFA